jgi:hypothetical protein
VDEGAKRALDERIRQARMVISEREEAQQTMSGDERQMNADQAEYKRNLKALTDRKDAIIKIEKRITQVKAMYCKLRLPTLGFCYFIFLS